MSVAVRATPTLQFTACSPAWSHECYGTPYLNSICYQWNRSSGTIAVSNITSAFKECTKQKVDLVFLFDGSLSMKNKDFVTSKEFIKTIMKSMSNTSIQFAAVQFSKVFRTVFTFKDFQDNKAFKKLDDEEQMKSLTHTHGAMHYALNNLFDESESGRHPDATKVVVIITDGNPSDPAIVRVNGISKLIVEVYEDRHIMRFVIADTLILGSVGSHNSKGSLYQIEGKGSPEKEIQDPEMQDDSYMGYSVAVGKKNGIPLYFTGAPRYKHKGQVIVFSRITSNWTVTQRLDNEQIGSYFGAELCAVDIDSDGTTDFLMVGAPLHYHPQREGQMYVYALTRENKLEKMQNISESSKGRFASSIASLRDLNGDGLQDLAVGAPLEDEHRGAVYIYLGDKTMGIRQKYSQRIRAKMLSEGLQQFGVTIDGKSNMDGLTEIAVGARGQVVLLRLSPLVSSGTGVSPDHDLLVDSGRCGVFHRSRPVFDVSAHLSFSPSEISNQQFDCTEHKEAFPTVNLTICFKMSEETKSTKDVLSTGLTLDYDLMLDSQRKNSRGFLAAKNVTLRSIQPRLHLNKTEMCQNHTIYMPSCVMDTLSPVNVKVNFSQAESQQPHGIINVDSKREAVVEVPFEKTCGHNATCVAKLQLDFNFTSSALLVFTDQDYLYVRVALSNVGDDSYYTSLHFHYPKGLSHSKLDVIKRNKITLTRCDGDPDKTDLTVYSVFHTIPVFRSESWAVFNGSFLITSSLEWNDFITMTITAHSDNGDPKDISLSKTLPVLFAVNLAVTFLDTPGASTTYVDYSLEDRGPKTHLHICTG
ncbi:integrin alpha-L-like [Clupea harengus]|uniref:Integrin alpha-L-like n=1 Tax=Clupea harengus TaxID=7950 RepID=A0A8M1K744_CLUHA|nr:integrin alpha-L-like [Clupea harengus]